ncbi:MAG: AAA family ATPase [Bdellovibrionales bacterium]
MFNEFYNLKSNPFAETPDTNFFYKSKSQCNVLAHLVNLLDQGQGFAMLTGEVGSGKTFLSRVLLSVCEPSAETALLLYPKLQGAELFEALLEEFGVSPKAGANQKALLKQLTEFLIQTAQQGKTSVVVVDEAQHLSLEALENIRLLSNIELESKKLLQIILVGQPELASHLTVHEARQINQRIGLRLQLQPFSLRETEEYIKHRIEVAGGANYIGFSEKSVELIHRLSQGVPRLINLQCGLILSYGKAQGIRRIDESDVRRALLSARVLRVSESILPWRRHESLVQA